MVETGPVQTERLIRDYLEQARLMEAMVIAKKAIEDHPRWPEFRVLLADVYLRDRKPVLAREQLDSALRADPALAVARALLERLAAGVR